VEDVPLLLFLFLPSLASSYIRDGLLICTVLSQTFKSISSIRNYVSGAKLLHILTDTSIIAFQTTELKLALKGMARLNLHCPKQAAPITPEILMQF
jgi:hypothetical protein